MSFVFLVISKCNYNSTDNEYIVKAYGVNEEVRKDDNLLAVAWLLLSSVYAVYKILPGNSNCCTTKIVLCVPTLVDRAGALLALCRKKKVHGALNTAGSKRS